jgi:GR25 family glycosyltransferase involved in LPS biosynthesis
MIVQDNPTRWTRYFDAVFWVGLHERRDRREFWQRNNAHEFPSYPVHYWKAVNPWKLKFQHDPATECFSDGRGHLGCYMSHYFLLRTIAAMQVNALVLEDDARVAKNFLRELDTEMKLMAQDWDVLRLGGYTHHRWKPAEEIVYGGYQPEIKAAAKRNAEGMINLPYSGMWAYMIRWEVADRMADEMMERCRHADMALDTMYSQHEIRLYSVRKPLAFHCYGQVMSHSSPHALTKCLGLKP